MKPATARQRILLFLTSCLVFGCSEPTTDHAEFFVFGTQVEVSLSGSNPATTQTAFRELQEMFQSMHRDWHAWEPGKLTELNQAFADGQARTVDDRTATLIRQSQSLETASGGRFNPAIGHLIELWGFHTSDYPIQAPVPVDREIQALLADHPSSLDIQLELNAEGQWQAWSDNPAVQLDLGGIAKGYAVDLALEYLRGKSMEGAIVNAGGDLRAFGSHHGQPWRIAVQNPLGGIIGVIETSSDEAIFTSGNYQRFGVDENGFRYAHILDPGTGWPLRQVLSASVIASNGLIADAAATALVVAGLDEWKSVAKGLNLEFVLMTDEAGKIYMTRAMRSRIALTPNQESSVELLD